ncbi:MAG: ABC transporter permease [Lachnospiraceae bacterium]|nr:ABC transporter permease [Lachnospiraceae bacterium]
MNKAALFKGRLSASLRDIWTIIILFISILLSVWMAWQMADENAGHFRVGIVDHDHGEFVDSILDALDQEYNIEPVLMSEEDAEKQLTLNQIECYVVIAEGFTDELRHLNFDRLLALHIRSDSNYSSAVTAPITAEVLKTWVEEKVITELNNLTDLTSEEEEDIRSRYETIWKEGSQIEIVMSPQTDLSEELNSRQAKPAYTWQASAWYSMLACFYIILSGRWMSDFRNHDFLLRTRQRGCSIAGLFFPQALPDILLTMIGYLPVCIAEQGLLIREHHVIFSIASVIHNGTEVLTHYLAFFLFTIGTMGISLIICATCKYLSTLLFMAPLVSVFTSIFSGLIVDLPKWTSYLSTFTRILPGYWFGRLIKYETINGGMVTDILSECVVSVIWILISILYIYIMQGITKKQRGR